SAWPRPIVQELLVLITAGCRLAAAPPLDSATHLALGGWLAALERLRAECEPLWPTVDAETRRLFERDRPLLKVAERARKQRLGSAWGRRTPPSECASG